MTETGRAALFFGPGQPMRIEEYPVPEPEPAALVVRVTRANVCGSDLHVWRGDGRLAAMASEEGRILGHEMVGIVSALGQDVTTDWAGHRLTEGDRVVYQFFEPCGRCRACLRGRTEACPSAFGLRGEAPSSWPHFRGGFADYFYVTPRMAIFKVPDAVPDTVASGANCSLATVVHGLKRVGPGLGDTVVVQGAGGLGLCAIALAKERGAGPVIVIDGLDDRLALARAMGADEVVDLREHDTADARVARVRALTGGWGADVVCELVGAAGVIPEGLRMLAPGGRYAEIGVSYTGTTVGLDPGVVVTRNARIEGIAAYDARSLAAALEFADRTAGRLPLDAALGAEYALEDIDRAFADQEAGAVARASIVL